MKHTKEAIAEARESLLKTFPKGSTVFTIVEHVAASGMSRTIRVLGFMRDDSGALAMHDGEPMLCHPNHSVSVLLGRARDNKPGREGIKCQGCGMDMGFDLVYNLSHALYGDGYSLKQRWL